MKIWAVLGFIFLLFIYIGEKEDKKIKYSDKLNNTYIDNKLSIEEEKIFRSIFEINIEIINQENNVKIFSDKKNAYNYIENNIDEIRSLYIYYINNGGEPIPQSTNDKLMNRFIIENKEHVRTYLLSVWNIYIDLLLKENENNKLTLTQKYGYTEELFLKKLDLFLKDNKFSQINYNDYKVDIIKNNEYSSDKCDIKGNISFNTGEKIYHLPGCEYYNSTKIDERYGERWFCSETEAKKAGWRKAYNCN